MRTMFGDGARGNVLQLGASATSIDDVDNAAPCRADICQHLGAKAGAKGGFASVEAHFHEYQCLSGERGENREVQ